MSPSRPLQANCPMRTDEKSARSLALVARRSGNRRHLAQQVLCMREVAPGRQIPVLLGRDRDDVCHAQTPKEAFVSFAAETAALQALVTTAV